MSHELIIGYGGLAGVLIAAITVIVTLRGIRDQLWLSTFSEYTARYSEVMEDVPFAARDPHGPFDLDSLPIDQRERVLGAVRKYANLCSEELFLYRRGRIDKETWNIWQTGIRDTMRTPCFGRGWELVRGEYEYYPAFREMMDNFIQDWDTVGSLTRPRDTHAR